MDLGIVGKPNTGKSTFWSAATLANAEIANYPFTTIKANQGVTYVKIEDVSKELNVTPNPNNSKVVNGFRFIPITIFDIAGLVPGAHEGKGLGNQFLNDLSTASALIHVVDISGGTDIEGNPLNPGEHDPTEDVKFLEQEIDYWLVNILENNWGKIERKVSMSHEKISELLFEQLSGLKVSEKDITTALKNTELETTNIKDWGREGLLKLATELRKNSKPIIIAANKIDIPGAKENLKKLQAKFSNYKIIPCCAEAELALTRAAKQGLIEYTPGNSDFKIISEIDEKQAAALEYIKKTVLKEYGSTGIQEVINKAVFDLLNRIVVYPVEDENKFAKKTGEVLPDTYLLQKGLTVLDLAYKIHTDLGKKCIGAINAKTKRRLGKSYILQPNDIIKILTQ